MESTAEIVRKTGVELIADERRKQRLSKGYTVGHDDLHEDQQLLVAAGALVLRALNEDGIDPIPNEQFLDEYCQLQDLDWVKYIVNHDRPDNIKGLVVAGALIAAEIDRLQRRAPHD